MQSPASPFPSLSAPNVYRTKAFVELSEEFGGTTGVFRRLYEAADNVSREEMAAIASLQPLFEFELFRILMDVVMFLNRSRETLLPLLRRTNKLRPDHQQLLRIYWKAACLSGHLSILCGLSGPDFFRKIPEQLAHPTILSVPKTCRVTSPLLRPHMLATPSSPPTIVLDPLFAMVPWLAQAGWVPTPAGAGAPSRGRSQRNTPSAQRFYHRLRTET